MVNRSRNGTSIRFLFFPIDVGKVGENCVILWLEKWNWNEENNANSQMADATFLLAVIVGCFYAAAIRSLG